MVPREKKKKKQIVSKTRKGKPIAAEAVREMKLELAAEPRICTQVALKNVQDGTQKQKGKGRT